MKTYEECEQLIIDTEFNGVAPIILPPKTTYFAYRNGVVTECKSRDEAKNLSTLIESFYSNRDEVDLSRKEFYKFKQMVFECCISEAYITMNTATGISRKQFDILNELVTNFDSDLDDLDSESDEYFQYLYERIYEVNSYIIRYETP